MDRPYIIGITGGSGAGKTTFVEALRQCFSNDEICFVSQDDYYRPRQEQLTDHKGIKNFDKPRSIDKKAFVEDLQKLIAGQLITRKEYVFNNEQKVPRVLTLTPAPIIIVEGIFIFHFKKIRKLLDLKIFIHAKENLKVIRRIKRDKIERNYPLEDVLYRYEHHVLPTFEKYIKPYIEACDLVVNNNQNFEQSLEVVKGFLRYKLNKVSI